MRMEWTKQIFQIGATNVIQNIVVRQPPHAQCAYCTGKRIRFWISKEEREYKTARQSGVSGDHDSDSYR